MLRRPQTRALVVWSVLGLLLAFAQVPGQDAEPTAETYLDSFEGPQVSWRQEVYDIPYRLRVHERSELAAYDGQTSERFQFVAGPGHHFYYSYPLPEIPVTDDLRVTLSVRASRPGVQLLAKVILPGDTDPETGQPTYVMVQGAAYNESDRWRRLELSDIPAQVRQQAILRRAQTERAIPIEGAYLERLVLNLYCGPGETEVFLDDLRINPVPPEVLAQRRPEAEPSEFDDEFDEQPDRRALLDFQRNRLSKWDQPDRRHYPWVPTIIDAPGADVAALRKHGFDVYATRIDAAPETIEEAIEAGFLLMPMLNLETDSASNVEQAIRQFPESGSVAFWNLGERFGASRTMADREAELRKVRSLSERVRALPDGVSRLSSGGVLGDFPLYARPPGRLDLIGAHPEPWGRMLQLKDYYEYLQQRRTLTALFNLGGFFWTWIPATPPSAVRESIWGEDAPPAWGQPQVLPEQVRLFTYAALSAGYRGVGYRSDANLTRESGIPTLIEMAFLNAEIDLVESFLAQAADPIRMYDTFPPPAEKIRQEFGGRYDFQVDLDPEIQPHPTIKAAAFETRDHRGTLLLVTDYGEGVQWTPPQLAAEEIRIRIPGHQSATAWKISLGEVTYLDRKKVPGGIEIVLRDFGPTGIVLLTTDLAFKEEMARIVRQNQSTAVRMALDQAERRFRAVTETHGQLVADSHQVEDTQVLLDEARRILDSARDLYDRQDYGRAWAEARRVSRPLRMTMRRYFLHALGETDRASVISSDEAIERLVTPVSSPPLLAFNTLPQHYIWTSAMRDYPLSDNLLPVGAFEDPDPETFRAEGWQNRGYEVDGLLGLIENVRNDEAGQERGSERALRLRVMPEPGRSLDEFPPFQDHPIAAVESPPVSLGRHEFVRISVLVKMPKPVAPGAGGLIVRDSLGGETLQFRTTDAIGDWKRVILYRRAPADCELTVTLGLAATVGEAYFDDLRVERATRPPSPTPERTPYAETLPEVEASPTPTPTQAMVTERERVR